MSYEKAMRWNKKHPKGTRQPVIMHTDSGFWPSKTFLDAYFEYRIDAETTGIEPVSCEEYYRRGDQEIKTRPKTKSLLAIREHLKNAAEYYREQLAAMWEKGEREGILYDRLLLRLQTIQERQYENMNQLCPFPHKPNSTTFNFLK